MRRDQRELVGAPKTPPSSHPRFTTFPLDPFERGLLPVVPLIAQDGNQRSVTGELAPFLAQQLIDGSCDREA